MRRLWHGETIIGHDGPAGRYPFLRLDPAFDEDIPLGITAFGAEHAARSPAEPSIRSCCTRSSTTRRSTRCVRTVKEAAERGRPRPSDGAGVVVPGDDR